MPKSRLDRSRGQSDHLVASAGLLRVAGARLAGRERAPPVREGAWARASRWLGVAPPARLLRVEALCEALRAGAVDAFTHLALDIDDTLVVEVAGAPPDLDGAPGVRAVEPGTARLVAALQDAGVPVFGLTARPPIISPFNVFRMTREQLAGCGIDFGRRACLPNCLTVPLRHAAAVRGGVFYCGDNSKGAAVAFLARWRGIRRLTVVDDNLVHFRPLIGARRTAGIELTLVHYVGAMGDDQQEAAWLPWIGLRLGLGFL